jgi:hypothetical protein
MKRILDENSMIAEAILLRYEGKNDDEISKILGISLTKLGKIGKKSRSLSKKKYHTIPDNITKKAIKLFEEGKNDTQISEVLGISRTKLREIRKIEGFNPSSGGRNTFNYTSDQINNVIKLIMERNTISEISRITKINKGKIRRIREEEIRKGNPLPEFMKGSGISRKYSDEEIITLAELNPGFGFDRFVQELYPRSSRTRPRTWIFALFEDFKNFCGIDLYNLLNDESYSELVSIPEYKEKMGSKYAPRGYGRNAGGRTPKPDRIEEINSNLKVPLPPQDFKWVNIESRDK